MDNITYNKDIINIISIQKNYKNIYNKACLIIYVMITSIENFILSPTFMLFIIILHAHIAFKALLSLNLPKDITDHYGILYLFAMAFNALMAILNIIDYIYNIIYDDD